MSPEAAELLEEIERMRARARDLADASEAATAQSAETSKGLARELARSRRKRREATKVLRRAGLLK